MADFAHYMRREVVEVDYEDQAAPWFAENQPDTQGFESPSYHVTRANTGPATRVREGDVLWLFSQLFTPWGKFPPSLDAKINVNAVKLEPRKIRYEAGTGSKWFPLYDATAIILRLRTIDSNSTMRPLLSRPEQPIGQALQSMRELANPNLLTKWERELESIRPDFISYRLIDGTRLAYEKAVQLVKEGRPIFWDRWSLPRRLAERREFLNDKALDAHLHKVIGQCREVWGIRSAKYGEHGSYSARELEEAQRLQKLKFYPPSADGI